MTMPPDWDSLIQKHLDGQTNEEEAAELSEQIVANADIRSDYLRAAQLHSALNNELLAFEKEQGSTVSSTPAHLEHTVSSTPTRKQVPPSLIVALLAGLLGAGMAWAISAPKAEVRALHVADGTFDTLPAGPVQRGFSSQFGIWSGDPLEIAEQTNGNRRLRFMETGNVKGDPNGGASACNAFQFIDLTSLRDQLQAGDANAQHILKLSVRFERTSAPIDEAFPKLRADCHIYLFDTEPSAIVDGWPDVLNDVVAVAKKRARLTSGQASGRVRASCLLEPEATVALITLNVSVGMETTTPVKLGNFFADDVKLTLTSRPDLPVRVVKLNPGK